MCGTAVCEAPQVCCLKKAPPLALCIDAANFQAMGCEKMDLPCFTSTDCPEGLACCLGLANLTVTCRPQLYCPGDGVETLIACETEADCPFTAPACSKIGMAEGRDFKVCGPGG